MCIFKGNSQSKELPLALSHKGFLSGYFLAVLLFCTMLTSMILTNDIHRIHVIENMKEYKEMLQAETEALAFAKCMLRSDQLVSQTIDTNWGSYDLIVQEEDAVIITIHGKCMRTFLINYDGENGEIISAKIIG